MTLTDPIADLFVRLKNALRNGSESVDVPHSKIKENILRILLAEGLVGRYETLFRMKKAILRVNLKYDGEKKPVIKNIKRISRPGRRIYVKAENIPWVEAGFGIAIISTPRGMLTDEQARSEKIGGEVICQVW